MTILCRQKMNLVTGELVKFSAIKYDVIQLDLTIDPVGQFSDIAKKTPTMVNGRLVELVCAIPNTKDSVKYPVRQDKSGLYLIDNEGVPHIVDISDLNKIRVRKTVIFTASDGSTTFFMIDYPSTSLCVATANPQGKIFLTNVTRVPAKYSPPAPEMAPQEIDVMSSVLKTAVPPQLSDVWSKKITIGANGDLLLTTTDGKKSFTYKITEDVATGLLTIVESDKAYMITVLTFGFPTDIKNMVRGMYNSQPYVLSTDDKWNICYAFYNDVSGDVDCLPVRKQTTSITPRSLFISAPEYRLYLTACLRTLPPQYGASTKKKFTTNANGNLVLLSVNPDNQMTYINPLYSVTTYDALVFVESHITYLVTPATDTTGITVFVAVSIRRNDEVVVLLIDPSSNLLSSLWYDNQGNPKFVQVHKQSGGYVPSSRVIELQPQPYDAFDWLFDTPLPPQFSVTSDKKLTMDTSGALFLITVDPSTQHEIPYKPYLLLELGLYLIEDNAKTYLLLLVDGQIFIKLAAVTRIDSLVTLFTNDEAHALCTAKWDDTLDAVKLTQVGRKMMDCTPGFVTMGDKEFRVKLYILNRTLAVQFLDESPKSLSIGDSGNLILTTKVRRNEYSYPLDLDPNNGFYTFLYKGKLYIMEMHLKEPHVRMITTGQYNSRTYVYKLNDITGELGSLAYDCLSNLIIVPVVKLPPETPARGG